MPRDPKKRGNTLEARTAADNPQANLVLRKSMQKTFLEAYEARQASTRIDKVAVNANVPWREFQAWCRDDPDFVQALAEIDNRRISLVRNIFVTDLEEVARKTLEIAKGDGGKAVKAQQLIYEVVGITAGRRGQGVSIFNKVEVNQDDRRGRDERDPERLKEQLESVKAQLAEFEVIETEDDAGGSSSTGEAETG